MNCCSFLYFDFPAIWAFFVMRIFVGVTSTSSSACSLIGREKKRKSGETPRATRADINERGHQGTVNIAPPDAGKRTIRVGVGEDVTQDIAAIECLVL